MPKKFKKQETIEKTSVFVRKRRVGVQNRSVKIKTVVWKYILLQCIKDHLKN